MDGSEPAGSSSGCVGGDARGLFVGRFFGHRLFFVEFLCNWAGKLLGWQASSSQLFRRFVALSFGLPSFRSSKEKRPGWVRGGSLPVGLGISGREGQAVRGYGCILQREFPNIDTGQLNRRPQPRNMASSWLHVVFCGPYILSQEAIVSPSRRFMFPRRDGLIGRQQPSTTLKAGG